MEVWGFSGAVGLEVIAAWKSVELSSLCLLVPSSALQQRQVCARGGCHVCKRGSPMPMHVLTRWFLPLLPNSWLNISLNSSLSIAFSPCSSTGLWSYIWQSRCHSLHLPQSLMKLKKVDMKLKSSHKVQPQTCQVMHILSWARAEHHLTQI